MDDARYDADDATIAAHDDGFPFDAVAPPIFQTSLFTFPSYADMLRRFRREAPTEIYSRVGNPTVAVLEDKIARLEKAEAAVAYNTGMAAISGVLFSLVKAGDRVVCVRHVYPDAYRLFNVLAKQLDIAVEYVDGQDFDAVRAALPGARLLYLESPTSWTFETLDLPALAAAAQGAGVVSVVDNSWATPVFQKPLTHGIDLVLHSASKYLNGHSDTVAGVVAGSQALIDRLNDIATPYLGAKLSPFDAWLVTRGLRTLDARMRQHQQSGLRIARRLTEHPAVEAVHHPGLRAACPTLTGSSSLFAMTLSDSIDIPAFCDALHLFKLGVSWGGYESLALPAMITLQQQGGPNSAVDFGVSPRLVRLHIGLEDEQALWADLAQALDQASATTQTRGGEE